MATPAAECTLPGHPTSVAEARHFVAAHLVGLPPDTVDTVTLLVSELSTNAVVHARSEFHLRLVQDPETVRIEVTDFGEGMPSVRDPGPMDLRGRGLLLLDRIATAWGVEPRTDGQGKTLWFTVGTGG